MQDESTLGFADTRGIYLSLKKSGLVYFPPATSDRPQSVSSGLCQLPCQFQEPDRRESSPPSRARPRERSLAAHHPCPHLPMMGHGLVAQEPCGHPGLSKLQPVGHIRLKSKLQLFLVWCHKLRLFSPFYRVFHFLKPYSTGLPQAHKATMSATRLVPEKTFKLPGSKGRRKRRASWGFGR